MDESNKLLVISLEPSRTPANLSPTLLYPQTGCTALPPESISKQQGRSNKHFFPSTYDQEICTGKVNVTKTWGIKQQCMVPFLYDFDMSAHYQIIWGAVLGVVGIASMYHIRRFDILLRSWDPVPECCNPARQKQLSPRRVGTQVKASLIAALEAWILTPLICRDQRPAFMYLLLSCYHTEINTLQSCTEGVSFHISCVLCQKMRNSEPKI